MKDHIHRLLAILSDFDAVIFCNLKSFPRFIERLLLANMVSSGELHQGDLSHSLRTYLKHPSNSVCNLQVRISW